MPVSRRTERRRAMRIARHLTVCCAVGVGLVAAGAGAAPAGALASKAARPSVSSLSPTAGSVNGGTRVTVHGAHFAHIKKVLFGTKAGTHVKVLSTTKLTVTSPAHTAGSVSVHVMSKTGTSATTPKAKFTYGVRPSVTAVSPNSGPVAGGNTVTLTGSHFNLVKKVVFGTTAGTSVHVVSASKLTVTAPAHAAGDVDIKVVTAYGSSPGVAGDSYLYNAPTPTTLSWGDVTPADTTGGGITALSCPTTSFCAAIDNYGNAFTYDGTQWSSADHIDSSETLRGLSCASASFCVATDTIGYVFMYNGAGWDSGDLIATDDSTVMTVSCPTGSFCMAGGYDGAYSYSDGTWSGPTAVGTVALVDISCPTISFCMAINASSDAYTWQSGSGWNGPTDIDGTGAGILYPVSCPSASFCAAVGVDDGNQITYASGTWNQPGTIASGGSNTLASVSCATSTMCVAVGRGSIGASTWLYTGQDWQYQTGIDPAAFGFDAVSCPTASTCIASDGAGTVVGTLS
jgi:hypothetical protein